MAGIATSSQSPVRTEHPLSRMMSLPASFSPPISNPPVSRSLSLLRSPSLPAGPGAIQQGYKGYLARQSSVLKKWKNKKVFAVVPGKIRVSMILPFITAYIFKLCYIRSGVARILRKGVLVRAQSAPENFRQEATPIN